MNKRFLIWKIRIIPTLYWNVTRIKWDSTVSGHSQVIQTYVLCVCVCVYPQTLISDLGWRIRAKGILMLSIPLKVKKSIPHNEVSYSCQRVWVIKFWYVSITMWTKIKFTWTQKNKKHTWDFKSYLCPLSFWGNRPQAILQHEEACYPNHN